MERRIDMRFLNNSRRYILLSPIIIMIVFCLYFIFLEDQIEESLLNEKFKEKQQVIDMIAYTTNHFITEDNDWVSDRSYYMRSLQLMTESLDSNYMTFAAVYNEDLSLVSTHLQNDDLPFDPLNYKEFKYSVLNNEAGDVIIDIKGSSEGARKMYLYYKWIPTNPDLSGRFLVAIGISELSIITKIHGWVIGGAMALIFITTLLNGIMIWIITHMRQKN
jgi:hypothetical protein